MYLLLVLAFKHLKIALSCGLEYMYCTLRFRHYSSYSMLRALLSILTLFHVWKVCVVRFEVTLLIVKKSYCTLLKINKSPKPHSCPFFQSVLSFRWVSRCLLCESACLKFLFWELYVYIWFFLFWKTFTHFTFFLFWF